MAVSLSRCRWEASLSSPFTVISHHHPFTVFSNVHCNQ
nr:MAG TPA_asm: hypothetical protein [Caudoviricetes sp.]